MATTIQDYVTVTKAAKELNVTRQRMHALIKIYGVMVEPLAEGTVFLIAKKELRKIPGERPSGVHISRRKK